MLIANMVTPLDGHQLHYDSIILRISRLATYLRHSPQRQEKFSTTVSLIYDEDKPTNVTSLLSHVSTRWNSTYNMLQRALLLKDAYNQFCTPDNMECFCPAPLEWEKVQVIIDFLKPLYEATMIACGSNYPTINQALPLYILLIKCISQVSSCVHIGQL
ncbi:hypothetical protein O181_019233 [Austropuccinia psidii MF-1]|uniref:Uncharacterized protein n=1 Tax=Austropuccinia psidii MF-1 TaxID=1389203 RepID=A0A9Q3CAK3_9BASI|nr:hypothetical protein [Austropuccinia psidii MF-1]